MAPTHRQQFLTVMKSAELEFGALFAGLAARAADIVAREAREGGHVPATRSQAIRDAAGVEVTRLFLAPAGGGRALVPFEVIYGRVLPRAPYMAALWTAVEAATRVAVDQQAFYMRRALKDAPDVLSAFLAANRNPFVAARTVSEQIRLRQSPFLSYDPLHRFVSPDGYTLSDRIWRVSGETRRRIDRLLEEAIAEGRGAREIAKELEKFLQPGRALIRTRKPYGTNGSFDAMRLARTEITAAHSRAGWMAAQLNPFVSGYEVVLSPAHKCCDICDEIADGGPYDLADQSYLPPFHPHCMCHTRWVMLPAAESDAMIDELRADMKRIERSLVSLIGPLLVDRFVRLLLDELSWEGVA